MAGAGTITKYTPTFTRATTQEIYFLLTVSEDTPTGLKEIARFKHAAAETAQAKAVEAADAGYAATITKVHRLG